jgi:hypothetical protein
LRNVVKLGKYSLANVAYVCIIRAEIVTIFGSKMVTISARNTNMYKICKLRKAYIFRIYNISQPNFAILLILISSLQEFTFLPRSKISLTCKLSIHSRLCLWVKFYCWWVYVFIDVAVVFAKLAKWLGPKETVFFVDPRQGEPVFGPSFLWDRIKSRSRFPAVRVTVENMQEGRSQIVPPPLRPAICWMCAPEYTIPLKGPDHPYSYTQ